MGQSHTLIRPSNSSTSSRRRTLSSTFRPAPTPTTKAIPSDNIFVPIQQDDILGQIPIHVKHPLPRTGIEDSADKPIQTNKFYANAFLGKQDQPIWTQPYFLWWGRGGSNPDPNQFATWGMNVGHVESGDLLFGPGDPPKYYSAPRKQSVMLGAKELDGETVLTTDTHLPHSVNINLRRGTAADSPKITFPVVQGMSFVTAGYQNASPFLQTAGKGFVGNISNPVLIGRSTKYRFKDCDRREWLIYINPASGLEYDATKLTRIDINTILFSPKFNGTIQVARAPPGTDAEALYDKSKGTFVAEAKLYATVNDVRGTYGFNYTKIGNGPLLMFLLPHHIQSLDPELRTGITKLQLQTATKGIATAVWATGDSLSFTETNLPTTMGFAPWTPTMTIARTRFPPDFLLFLSSITELDLRRAMSEPIPQDSYYYAGKSLSKFATLLWVIKDVLNDGEWVAKGLDKLKAEMAQYINNVPKFPLYYDDTWKGLVSKAGLEGDSGSDFGNTWYNDHHFHFGYFIYTAAVIGALEQGWLEQGDNKRFINMMVKDIAESKYEGGDFPFQRCFDWYAGHSWAKGLFESADGKDEESTSEDGFASYAIKMWGKVIGDANMEKRGNLMLAVQARAFNTYFYLTSTNTSQPARFLPHKITGVLFENKVDYATYFGDAPHLVHGIHMLPLAPPSTFLRPRAFVREEWDAFFALPSTAPANPHPNLPSSPQPLYSYVNPFHTGSTSLHPSTPLSQPPRPALKSSNSKHRAQSDPPTGGPCVDGGWRGVLFANLAIVDAKSAYAFFRDGVGGVWDERWVDVGATRSWYLVWCASLGGVSAR
ncbi:endo-1,3(4)-beta-glucanase 1 precursor [Bimuria novae-zelandiae CBS 107.79]|uniref:glucan endo-1,3-beta-D-glucosidase n=1 Tax=Bimuria novae-zelandiae CBS 107.79 TaxID=1447943 RepID=A0A6A5V878_9PLEO|nr:endo-1,3(4)-beta-glucanase 1 precursor [Bimuria novae-zelandiae CBS 107.79]